MLFHRTPLLREMLGAREGRYVVKANKEEKDRKEGKGVGDNVAFGVGFKKYWGAE